MATKKQIRLAEKLISDTERGYLDWQEGPRPETYQLSLKNSAMVISRVHNDYTEQSDIIIEILNGEGLIVDSFSDVELTQYAEESWYPKLNNLYESARRTALGSERLIDEILVELEEAGLRNLFK